MTVNLLSGCPPTEPPPPPPPPGAAASPDGLPAVYDDIYDVTISRSASRFTRVFQPPPLLAAALRGRRAHLLSTNQTALAVTSSGGIVHVRRPDQLSRAVSPVILRLVTSTPPEPAEIDTESANSTGRNATLVSEVVYFSAPVTTEPSDAENGTVQSPAFGAASGFGSAIVNVTVRVWLAENGPCSEPGVGGGSRSAPERMCAAKHRADECENTCGFGANGTCSWRPPEANMTLTREYGTCSSDLVTCPDGTCDPLEQLSGNLCPQDCAGKWSPQRWPPLSPSVVYVRYWRTIGCYERKHVIYRKRHWGAQPFSL